MKNIIKCLALIALGWLLSLLLQFNFTLEYKHATEGADCYRNFTVQFQPVNATPTIDLFNRKEETK